MLQPEGSLQSFRSGLAHLQVYSISTELGAAAANRAAEILADAIKQRNRARVIVATGNSQIPLVETLVALPVGWSAVEVFHMDEYVGMSSDHRSSFRYWIRTRVEERVRPSKTHYLEGDAADLEAELKRYAQLLMSAPIDVAFVGFGENGHIAFNDPHLADFNDPLVVKKVTLDEACRKQQAGEGHFKDLESVPKEAVTITCPGLFRAANWVCCVPDRRKAVAVRDAVEGPISEACPASLVQRHPSAHVYLDVHSASLLSGASSGVVSQARHA